MEIELPGPLLENKKRSRAELELLLCQPGPQQVPPCQNCREHIVAQCNARCANAPSALSSDPERYPVEAKVVPLVYELRKTRVLQPCWSCEGHMGVDGKLWKYPQVSFYSATPLYAVLLVNYLTLLKHRKKLNHDWIIVISGFGQKHSGITYTIEPRLGSDTTPHLGRLHCDLITIAENLDLHIKQEARKMLDVLN